MLEPIDNLTDLHFQRQSVFSPTPATLVAPQSHIFPVESDPDIEIESKLFSFVDSESPFWEKTKNYWTSDITVTPVYSTASDDLLQIEEAKAIRQKIEILFFRAREERFEDGMDSNFSRGLISYIETYGKIALEAIEELILNEQVNPEVASEALRWLGHMEHPSTYPYRLWLLEQSLYRSSDRVRDGAALGLASLDDPHAIEVLKNAIFHEKNTELRYDMEQVLKQLEQTQNDVAKKNKKVEMV